MRRQCGGDSRKRPGTSRRGAARLSWYARTIWMRCVAVSIQPPALSTTNAQTAALHAPRAVWIEMIIARV